MYKSWDQKTKGNAIGYYLCSRKGMPISHIKNLSDEMLNDYAKVFYLKFKKMMNSLTKEQVQEFLPGMISKDGIKSDNINYYVNDEIFKFDVKTLEKDIGFTPFKKFSIFHGVNPIVIASMNWCEILPMFKKTPFFQSLTPLDWYGDLDYKEYIPSGWIKMFKALEKEYPEHKIEQISFLDKCSKVAALNPVFFKYGYNVYQSIYFLSYSGNKDLAISLAKEINKENSVINQNVFKVEKSLDELVFKDKPDLKDIFKNFLQKVESLDTNEIFENDDECFNVALAFTTIQKRFMTKSSVTNKVLTINKPEDLKSMLNSFFYKANEKEKLWTNCVKNITVINDKSFSNAKLVIFCAVDKDVPMLPSSVKETLINELENVLSVDSAFKVDYDRLEAQSDKLILEYDNENNKSKMINRRVKKF